MHSIDAVQSTQSQTTAPVKEPLAALNHSSNAESVGPGKDSTQ
jgi:hypothetical protein